MIQSFRSKAAQELRFTGHTRLLPQQIIRAAERKILQLHAAQSLVELRCPPGNKLELLQGDRGGQYSVRINKRWRLCFTWSDGNAYDVEIVDYH